MRNINFSQRMCHCSHTGNTWRRKPLDETKRLPEPGGEMVRVSQLTDFFEATLISRHVRSHASHHLWCLSTTTAPAHYRPLNNVHYCPCLNFAPPLQSGARL